MIDDRLLVETSLAICLPAIATLNRDIGQLLRSALFSTFYIKSTVAEIVKVSDCRLNNVCTEFAIPERYNRCLPSPGKLC